MTTPQFPLYIGRNRALIRLQTGGVVCVDTNSRDSLDYLLGWRVEEHIFPVFRRFLHADSTVLDIGANVGLYTVTAGNVVRGSGRLYSFEGNPHTFELLKLSAYSNKLLSRPNIVLVNALVGARSGRGTLYFNREELGGATMTETDQWGSKRESVEIDLVAIDNFLPPELVVDLVKIDVEGHEPFVIEGMEAVLARSVHVRLLIEFFDHMTERTYGCQRFVDLIHDLGFRMCRVLPDSSLELLKRGEVPRGENYCLLTRTPEEDIRRRHFVISLQSLRYPDGYLDDKTNRLLKNGRLWFSRADFADVGESALFYGPYINLAPGRYAVRFTGELAGTLNVRLTRNCGELIQNESLQSFDQAMVMNLDSPAENFEIVALRTESLERMELLEIAVETL